MVLCNAGSTVGQTLGLIVSESRCLNSGYIFCEYVGATAPITFSMTGPSGPSSVTINNANKHTFTALAPGQYQVIATDDNSVTRTSTVTVTGNYVLPSVSVDIVNSVTCPTGNDGTVQAISADGRASFFYRLYRGNNILVPDSLEGSSPIGLFNDLGVGQYTMVLMDSCSNQSTSVFNMASSFTHPTNIQASFEERLNCDSMEISIGDWPGYVWAPFPPPFKFVDTSKFIIESPPTQGSQTVLFLLGIDNNCPEDTFFVDVDLFIPSLDQASVIGVSCNDFDIGLRGDYLYNGKVTYTDPVSNNVICSSLPTIIEAAHNEDYWFTITDDCGYTTTRFFRNPSFIGMEVEDINPSLCEFNKAEVVLRFINGEVATNPVQVTFLSAPADLSAPITSNHNLTPDVTGEFIFSDLYTGDFGAGSYEVEFVDACNVKDTLKFDILGSDLLNASINALEVKTCGAFSTIDFSVASNRYNHEGLSLYEIGTNNYVGPATNVTQTFNMLSGQFINVLPGDYYIELEKCNRSDQVIRDTITVFGPVPLALEAASVGCNGELSITAVANGGAPNYEYRLLSGPISGANSGNIYPTAWSTLAAFSGYYTPTSSDPDFMVQVVDVCNNIVTYQVTDYPSLLLPQIDLMDVDCDPDFNLIFENLVSQEGVTYRWDFPDGSFSYDPDSSSYMTVVDTGTVYLTAELGVCEEVDSFKWTVTCNVVPIKWTDYAVTYRNGQIDMRWKMTGDDIIDRYYIEHKTENDDWSILHATEAIDQQAVYRHIHYNPPIGLNYYRIKAIDINGLVEFTTIKVVQVDEAYHADWAVYPNPASDVIYLSSSMSVEHSILSLYDSNGRLVRQEKLLNNRIHSVQLSDLSSGLYMLMLHSVDNQVLWRNRILKE